MAPAATRPSQNAAVLRTKSACLGARPSVIGHSQETRSCHYGNSPGMITQPGGPPRAKDTSHLALGGARGQFGIHANCPGEADPEVSRHDLNVHAWGGRLQHLLLRDVDRHL